MEAPPPPRPLASPAIPAGHPNLALNPSPSPGRPRRHEASPPAARQPARGSWAPVGILACPFQRTRCWQGDSVTPGRRMPEICLEDLPDGAGPNLHQGHGSPLGFLNLLGTRGHSDRWRRGQRLNFHSQRCLHGCGTQVPTSHTWAAALGPVLTGSVALGNSPNIPRRL